MQTRHKVLSRYDSVVCCGCKYLVFIEIDFAMVVNDEHVSYRNTDDGIVSNVSFVSFAEDSN